MPTWNYSAVHFTGRLRVEHDPEWLREAVTWLTELHENRRESAGHEAWSVDDAPAKYVDGQLRAIVGIQLAIEQVEAKAKLSQNRSDADRAGVVAGLRAEGGRRGEAQVADRMAEDLGLCAEEVARDRHEPRASVTGSGLTASSTSEAFTPPASAARRRRRPRSACRSRARRR